MTFEDRLKRLKLLVFDVDGVLTDNSVFMGENRNEYKRFNIADGLGFYMARRVGLELALVSGRYSAATDSRAQELGVIEVHQDIIDKAAAITMLRRKYGLEIDEISYMGDDFIDLKAMDVVGVRITVPHSPRLLQERVDYVTRRKAGDGAAREFIDMVLEARGVDMEEMWRDIT